MARDAIIGSLLRYAQILTGSCFPPDLLHKMNTQVLNIAARRVGGLARTARIESLHFITGAMSIYNMYIVHCADFLDSCLRAHNSSIQTRIKQEVSAYYTNNPFATKDVSITLPYGRIMEKSPNFRIPDIWHKTWPMWPIKPLCIGRDLALCTNNIRPKICVIFAIGTREPG